MMSDVRLACPKCHDDWQYGWDRLRDVLEFLHSRTTYCGKDGVEHFERIKCGNCQCEWKLSTLGL